MPFYKRLWFIICVAVFLLLSACWLVLQLLYPTTSPLKVLSFFVYSREHLHVPLTKQTLAFLPYWRLADTSYTRFDLLSEISYFSLTIDKNGNFLSTSGNQIDPGWAAWNSQKVKDLIAQTQIAGGTFSLTVASQKNKTIEAFLKSTAAQKHLFATLEDQITSRHLNGIIIDFEYDGNPDDIYRHAFTTFAKNLSTTLKTNPKLSLSLTLLPLAGREKGLFDLPMIQPYFDRFIGMSYDYYAQGSDIAGPVAPMSGFSDNKFFFDVTTTYKDYLKALPKEKILMGIPYYGYDWAVVNGKKIQSPTLSANDPNNYSAVISYARMREDKDMKQSQCLWDDVAQEPWCWYTDAQHVDHQVWFEDNKSIQVKYSYAKTNGFAGIALWTLGYDKQYPDLWHIMQKTFEKQN